MVQLSELVEYADALLDVGAFQDYCPNGLQIEGRREVRGIVSGVSASLDLIEAASAAGADLLLVHHGFFWKGEDPRLVGWKGRRIKMLLANDISLAAYHLPLDAHPQLGNNAGLAAALGITVEGCFAPGDIGMYGRVAPEVSAAAFADLIAQRLGRPPLHLGDEGRPVRRVGWCSGAAQGYIEQAAALGLDAYISGEVSEQTLHLARELGIHYFAAGHHATERFGVQALGQHLAGRFGLVHRYVDIPNPV